MSESADTSREELKIQVKVPWSKKTSEYRIGGSETVAQLKAKVECSYLFSSLPPLLSFGGTQLEDNCTLADYSIQNEATIDLSFQPPAGKMLIYLQDPKAETAVITMDGDDTLEMLKLQIHESVEIPLDEQRLCFGNHLLEGNQKLSDYSIQNGSVLALAMQMRAGYSFGFAFNDLKNVKKVPLNRGSGGGSVHGYRTISPGLILRSICRNPQCIANEDYVYVTKGFGQFHLSYESQSLLCPACNNKLEPATNCGFYMTTWKYEGVLADGEERKGPETRADTRDYYTFEDGDNVVWRYIIITTTPL